MPWNYFFPCGKWVWVYEFGLASCSWLLSLSGAGLSRCHHQCIKSTLSGPSLPVAPTGELGTRWSGPHQAQHFQPYLRMGKGGCGNNPKISWARLAGLGLCSPGLFCHHPVPVVPCLALREPPLHKSVWGGALLHLSLLPLPDLRGEKNANFGKTLWVLTGKGRGCSPHWRHPGDPFTYTPFQIPSSNFF